MVLHAGACVVPCICFWYLVFAPGSSKVAVGFFHLFVSLSPEFALNVHVHGDFSPLQLLWVLLSKRGASRCKHCSKEFQVPVLSPFYTEWLKKRCRSIYSPMFSLDSGCSGTPGKLVAASRPWGLLRDGSQVHLPTSDLRKLCRFRVSEDLRKLFLEPPFARGGSRLRDAQVQCSNRSCFCWLPIHLYTATFSCSLHLSFSGLPCL